MVEEAQGWGGKWDLQALGLQGRLTMLQPVARMSSDDAAGLHQLLQISLCRKRYSQDMRELPGCRGFTSLLSMGTCQELPAQGV